MALAGGDRLGTVWILDGLEVTIVGAIASRLTMALAFFYAVGTGIGGVTGPALFGKLVETGEEVNVFYGYLLGAVLMIAAGSSSGSSGSRRPAGRWRMWPSP